MNATPRMSPGKASLVLGRAASRASGQQGQRHYLWAAEVTGSFCRPAWWPISVQTSTPVTKAFRTQSERRGDLGEKTSPEAIRTSHTEICLFPSLSALTKNQIKSIALLYGVSSNQVDYLTSSLLFHLS